MPAEPDDSVTQEKLVRKAKRVLYGISFLGLIATSYFIARPIFDDMHDNKDDIETPVKIEPAPENQIKPNKKTDTIFPPKPILV